MTVTLYATEREARRALEFVKEQINLVRIKKKTLQKAANDINDHLRRKITSESSLHRMTKLTEYPTIVRTKSGYKISTISHPTHTALTSNEEKQLACQLSDLIHEKGSISLNDVSIHAQQFARSISELDRRKNLQRCKFKRKWVTGFLDRHRLCLKIVKPRLVQNSVKIQSRNWPAEQDTQG